MIVPDTCPTDADLRLLIEGSIADGKTEVLTLHLDQCESCQMRLDRLAGGGGSWTILRALAERAEAGPRQNPWAITEGFLHPRTPRGKAGAEEVESIPATIGPYQVLGLLGRGGMGRVYKAYDPSLKRVVAVKVMATEWSGDATAKRRFLREARAAAAICHEHVVLVHAVEEGNPVPYIVMQLVPGSSLQELLADRGRLELREIIQIGKQTAAGLAAAHAQGIVHRDVKPANILLENGVQRVKISDFGLARAADDARLSQSGQFAGTPLYASPEQACGEDVDPRSDLFSLGTVLYELCTGVPAFHAATPMAVLKRICDDAPRPIRSLNPKIPEWLCAVIDKLLAKEASERFSNAAEVAELLEQYLAHLNQPAAFPHPPTVPRPRRRRTRRRWLAAGAGLLALVIAAVLLIRMGTNRDHPGPVAPSSPAPEDGSPFTVRPPGGGTGKGYYTLNKAVAAAPPGATIDVNDNGPFDVLPMTLNHPLRIRAAPGRSPVLHLVAEAQKISSTLITTTSSLSLEGLEIRELPARGTTGGPPLISVLDYTGTAEVRITHCRFSQVVTPRFLLSIVGARHVEVRDSAFLFDTPSGWAVALESMSGGKVVIEDCLFSGYGLSLGWKSGFPARQVDVLLRRNTWRTFMGAEAPVGLNQARPPGVPLPNEPAYRIHAVENIFAPHQLMFASWKWPRKDPQPDPAPELEAAFERLVHWHGQRNIYREGALFLGGTSWANIPAVSTRPRKTVASWNELPNVREVDSLCVPVTFADPPQQRQRPGERTAADLVLSAPLPERGADAQRVGPGDAYEAFRQSTTYADWDRAAGFTTEALRPWDRAFAVKSEDGWTRYATLAEACAAAPAGGVVEILHDGPFQVMPIDLAQPLTIRAGPGVRPKLVLSPLAPPFAKLIETDRPLVLEGLELYRRDADRWTLASLPPAILRTTGARVHVACCRFVLPTDGIAISAEGPSSVEVNGCEFLHSGSVFWMGGLSVNSTPGGAVRICNCVAAGHGSAVALWYVDPDATDSAVELERNTFWCDLPLVFELHRRPVFRAGPAFRVEGKRNLLRGRESLFRFEQTQVYLQQAGPRLTASAVGSVLPRLMTWKVRDDVHVGGREGFFSISVFGTKYDFRRLRSNEPGWRSWWGFPAHDPSTTAPTLAGEALLADPGPRLTDIRPQDFRVTGWQAGKGSPPGANVELVGPGAAYERWKKTPEYSAWRKRAGMAE